MSRSIRAAVLTISDTASADANADKSGPTIIDILKQQQFQCDAYAIVPDDEIAIRNAVLTWCTRGDVDWIVTTGGTGFGVRDRTPEAISPLLERTAPGIVHLMLSTSLKHTPMAALARPVAGTIKNTLVVTLPGSVKAVKENLEALLSGGVINHAIDLVKGGTGKQVHAALASSTDQDASVHVHQSLTHPHDHHHHHHHHHHDHSHHAPVPRSTLSHDPSLPASARHRESPFPLISLDDALSMVMNEIVPLGTHKLTVTPHLKGCVLAEDVYAPQDVPSSHTTNVDGYALRSTDPPGTYTVITSQTHALSTVLPGGSIYRINTGGPLPAGADTVIMVEDTRLISTYKNEANKDTEENEVETLVQNPPGAEVRSPGSDVKKGDLVLQKGEILHSAGGEIGTLAFVGRKEVEVYRKPKVALLSTGNEIVDIGSEETKVQDSWGGIWDTNRPSLRAALEGMGYEVIDLGIVPDDITAHKNAIAKGLEADILITTGGTSMGPTDLLKPVIERYFNGTIHFGRVKVKPGKPTTFATVAMPGGEKKPLFALPGNPASALVTFNIFVVPALRKLGGWPTDRCYLPRVRVQLQQSMRLDARPEFHRVIVRSGAEGLKAYSTGGQRSSRMSSLSGANGLIALPPRAEGTPDALEAGQFAEAVIIGEIQMY